MASILPCSRRCHSNLSKSPYDDNAQRSDPRVLLESARHMIVCLGRTPCFCTRLASPPSLYPPAAAYRTSTTGPRPCHRVASMPFYIFPSTTPSILMLPPIYDLALIVSKCFKTVIFASMNLSTQFCMQGCSYLSSWPWVILLVMHFLKHVSVRLCIAATCQYSLLKICDTSAFRREGLGVKWDSGTYMTATSPSATRTRRTAGGPAFRRRRASRGRGCRGRSRR